MIKSNWCFCSVTKDDIDYHVYEFKGHLFRVYTNNMIKKASESDIEAYKYFERKKCYVGNA